MKTHIAELKEICDCLLIIDEKGTRGDTYQIYACDIFKSGRCRFNRGSTSHGDYTTCDLAYRLVEKAK